MNKENQLTFLDLFSGIGGFRKGMEQAGHKCIGFCEFDKFARASYISMHCITEEQRAYLATMDLKKRQKEILKEEYLNDEWHSTDIRTVTGQNVPKADMWCAGFPCLVAGTLITTSEGMKPIEDVQVGDMVLTHKNRFQKVLKTMVSQKQGIYTLKVQGSPITEVTGNHRFYVRYKQHKYKNGIHYVEWNEPEWKAIEDFNGKENIIFPNPKPVNPRANVSLNESWLIGRYVADGLLSDSKRNNASTCYHSVTWCVGRTKKDEFENHLNGIKYSYRQCENSKDCIKYTTCDKRIFEICKGAGKGAANKKVPSYIMNNDTEHLFSFLNGYMSGDGYYHKTNGNYEAASVSKELIYQLGQCVNRVYGVPYSIYLKKNTSEKVICGKKSNQKDIWILSFRKEIRKGNHGYVVNGDLWMPVREIHYDPNRTEMVYNLEVENDNSYTANNMGLHNCTDISIAGKQLGFGGQHSSLFFELIRILKEQKEEDRPEWIILENVKNILSIGNGGVFARVLIELDDAGYDTEWQNFNSKDWGVPQNRERIYFVGHSRNFCPSKILPITPADGEDCVEGIEQIGVEQIGQRDRDNRKNLNQYRVYDPEGIAPCLNQMEGGGREPMTAIRVCGNSNPSGRGIGGQIYGTDKLSPTLTDNKGDGYKIAVPVSQIDSLGTLDASRHTQQDILGTEGISSTLDSMHDTKKVAIPVDVISPKYRGLDGGGSACV